MKGSLPTFVFLCKDGGMGQGDNHRPFCVSDTQLALQTPYNVFRLEILTRCEQFRDNRNLLGLRLFFFC